MEKNMGEASYVKKKNIIKSPMIQRFPIYFFFFVGKGSSTHGYRLFFEDFIY